MHSYAKDSPSRIQFIIDRTTSLKDALRSPQSMELKKVALAELYRKTFDIKTFCAYAFGPQKCDEDKLQTIVITIFMDPRFDFLKSATLFIDHDFNTMISGHVKTKNNSVNLVWWVNCTKVETAESCRIVDMLFNDFIRLSQLVSSQARAH